MASNTAGFCHLHLHTHSSAFDGLGTEKQFAEHVAGNGQHAFAVTEHGSIRGFFDHHKACKAFDLKAIYGVEMYLADDAEAKGITADEKDQIKSRLPKAEALAEIERIERSRRDRDHVTIWALDQTGLRNLYRLTSWAWTKGFYCLLPGQEIVVPEGVKRVEDVRVGDQVLTHRGRMRPVSETLQRQFKGTLYGVRLNNRYSRVTWMTGEHPVLIRDHQGAVSWVKARDLAGGRRNGQEALASWRSFVCLPKVRPDEVIAEIRTQDYVDWTFDGVRYVKEARRSRTGSTRHYANLLPVVPLDYDFGFFLGLYAAEGYTDGADTREVSLSLHRDEVALIERAVAEIRRLTGKTARVASRADRPDYKGVTVRVGHSVLAQLLTALCGRGANHKHLPDFAFASPVEFRRGLIEGVFAGDGSIRRETVILTQTSEALAWQVRSLAAEFTGSFPNVARSWDGREAHAPQYRSNYCPPGVTLRHRHTIADGEYVYRPIEEVLTREYDGEVLNFSVEEDDSYVSDFVMHNCKPRIDIRRLIQFNEGLAVSTGCPHGVVAWPLAQRKFGEAISRAEQLARAFGDRLYVEIMPHALPGFDHVPAMLVKLAARFGCKLIATQDAHYPAQEDAEAQEVLLCIHCRDRMANPDRFCFGSRDYWARTRAEMEEAFVRQNLLPLAVVRQAMDETLAFADRCTADLEIVKPGTYLVSPDLPAGVASHDAWILQLCRDGCRTRFGCEVAGLGQDYRDRLLHELRTIRDLGFASYFTMVWDVRNWARGEGIMQGPGRGSAAGSLVSYLLGITDLDPIDHGLMFERFLAPGRKDLPDVDMDYERARRGEVIEYLRGQYGEDRVAGIATHNMLRGKRVLRDVARVYDVPEREVAPVASLIVEAIEEELRDDASVQEVLTSSDIGRRFVEQHGDVAEASIRLEGQLRGVGMHAAGVVVSSVPIADVAPIESRADGGRRVPIVAWDMKAVEKLGLVKVDILGLNTLDIIDAACRTAGVDPYSIPMDDPATLQAFTDGRMAGVFQFDTTAARRACKGVIFDRFADVAIMTALDRPGPSKAGMPQIYADRCLHPEKIPQVHPDFDRVTAETRGVIVFQEQVIQLARQLAGYDAEQADAFRKKIAKKLGVSDEHDRFVDGAVANGMDLAVAEHLFNELVGFGAYAFNRSHSFAYAMISVWCMWLKLHHPAAFFAGYLANEADPNMQARIAIDARLAGIVVSAPDVQRPVDHFSLADREDGVQEIIGALSDVKGVGQSIARVVAQAAPFTGLADFYARTRAAGARVTVRTFEALARATAFRALYPNTRMLVANAASIWQAAKGGWDLAVDPAVVADWGEDDLALEAASVYPLFVTALGRSAFDADLARTMKVCKRQLLVPGDPLLVDQGQALVFGRLSGLKRFQAEEGKRSGRALLLGPAGEDLVLRIDHDVLEDCEAALHTLGTHVVAIVSGIQEERGQLDRVWLASDFASSTDDRVAFVRSPFRTRPADPAAAIKSRGDGQALGIDGMLLRIRQHRDKSGAMMATLGILGSAGYARVFVFASTWGESASRKLRPGMFVNVRCTKLSGGDVACLESWSEIRAPAGAAA